MRKNTISVLPFLFVGSTFGLVASLIFGSVEHSLENTLKNTIERTATELRVGDTFSECQGIICRKALILKRPTSDECGEFVIERLSKRNPDNVASAEKRYVVCLPK